MGTVLICELSATGPKVTVPIEHAWLMVMHAVRDHGIPLADVEAATRYVPPHVKKGGTGRWRLPGPRDWLY